MGNAVEVDRNLFFRAPFLPSAFLISARGKKDAARKWLLNLKYDGQLSIHSHQIALQVMGDYALRNPRRLKKVDKSHVDRISMGGAENQIPLNSQTLTEPPTKRCKRHSNDFRVGPSDLFSTMQNEDQKIKKDRLIRTLVQLHLSEWNGLTTDNLQYEVDKIKRLKPIERGSI